MPAALFISSIRLSCNVNSLGLSDTKLAKGYGIVTRLLINVLLWISPTFKTMSAAAEGCLEENLQGIKSAEVQKYMMK